MTAALKFSPATPFESNLKAVTLGLQMGARMGTVLIATAEENNVEANDGLIRVLDLAKAAVRGNLRLLLDLPPDTIDENVQSLSLPGLRIVTPQTEALRWALRNNLPFTSIVASPAPNEIAKDPWASSDIVGRVYNYWHNCAFGIMRARDNNPGQNLVVVTKEWGADERAIAWSLRYKQSIPEVKAIRAKTKPGYISTGPVICTNTLFVGDKRPVSFYQDRKKKEGVPADYKIRLGVRS